jgi:hypothetical protein
MIPNSGEIAMIMGARVTLLARALNFDEAAVLRYLGPLGFILNFTVKDEAAAVLLNQRFATIAVLSLQQRLQQAEDAQRMQFWQQFHFRARQIAFWGDASGGHWMVQAVGLAPEPEHFSIFQRNIELLKFAVPLGQTMFASEICGAFSDDFWKHQLPRRQPMQNILLSDEAQ